MSGRLGPADTHDESGGASAYMLLEEARLRCERLTAQAGTEAEYASLRRIHRELGMAGWLASTGIDASRRLALLSSARRRSTQPMPYASNSTHALAGTTISAEDAIGRSLTATQDSDHMHLAHLHVLHAEELLSDHL
jgi:hypothetical protein